MNKLSDTLWGIYVVAKREFIMNLKSVRMIILMIIFSLFVLFAAYVGSFFFGFIGDVPGTGDNVEKGPVIIAFFVVQFIGFIGPIIAIALNFDIIVKEKIQNSLNLLLCRPISKRSIALGKFIGVTGALAVPVIFVNLVALLIVMVISGKMIELIQIFGFLLLTMMFLAIYLALAQIISSVVKTTTTAILGGLGIWFLFWLFFPIINVFIPSAAISLINPGTSYSVCIEHILGLSTGPYMIPLWGFYLILITWLLATIVLAVELFHWKED